MRAHASDDEAVLIYTNVDRLKWQRFTGHSLDEPDGDLLHDVVDVERDGEDLIVTGTHYDDQISIEIREDEVNFQCLAGDPVEQFK